MRVIADENITRTVMRTQRMKAPPTREWTVAALLSFAFAVCAVSVSAQERDAVGPGPLGESLVPDPALSPDDVIRIQLEALRHNDEQNRGIAVAFRFASPANRVNTGPLPRFIAMIRGGPYALMLNFRHADYGPVETAANQARQRVTLTGTRAIVTYWFYLSRQSQAPYEDCWMTDAVYIEQSAGRAA